MLIAVPRLENDRKRKMLQGTTPFATASISFSQGIRIEWVSGKKSAPPNNKKKGKKEEEAGSVVQTR